MKTERASQLTPILQEKLCLLDDISGKRAHTCVVKTVVDYAVRHNDGRTFRGIDRVYGYDGVFSQFRKDHLENNYYIMGRLWRAVYQSVVRNRLVFKEFGVAKVDVALCRSMLTSEDKLRIKGWVKDHSPYVVYPNNTSVREVVAACEKTLNGVVNSKLRFIYQYDPAYEREDLVSFMRTLAYRVAMRYDWEMVNGKFDFAKSVNFTKRSLWNAAGLLIKQNTSADYSRLERVDSEERVYQTTTISMDRLESDWVAMYKGFGAWDDAACEVTDLVAKIDDPKLNVLLSLERREVPEFSAFVLREGGVPENDLYSTNYKLWRQYAMRFAGLTRKADRAELKRRVHRELGTLDKARMGGVRGRH